MDEEWWVRRAVLALLVVVGLATTAYAVAAVRGVPAVSAENPSQALDPNDPPEETAAPVPEGPLRTGEPLVVGRHGAPAERPAHTRESYELAAGAGADYLETEVVATLDGDLVALGDNDLTAITDVAERPEFAERETTKTVDGEQVTGWFSEDFTLEELLTLRAVEADPELRPGSAAYDGQLELLTLADVLDLVEELATAQDRDLGLFVELRRAGHFRDLGLAMERPLTRALERSGLSDDPDRVVVESVEESVLERVDEQLGGDVLTALVVPAEDADRLEADALADLAAGIDAVSVETGAFAGQDPYDLVARVHDAGLAMGVWPISYENELLAPGFRTGDDPTARGNLDGQVEGLVLIGVDVIFAEAPLEVVAALPG